jgi:hypothetical protein
MQVPEESDTSRPRYSARFSPERGRWIRNDLGKRRSQTTRRAQPVPMQTSTSIVKQQEDLSVTAASQSGGLDNPCGLQYGLELVIPMSSRRLEKR